jgi:hypothetical protein
MTVGRVLHTATLLLDGRVLIVGGNTGGNVGGAAAASAEIYDPATCAFVKTGSPVIDGTASLLPDGRVLIVGDITAEIYDPKTGLFAASGAMDHERSGHTATTLLDGRILIAGGVDQADGPVGVAEIYNPKTGLFSPTGSMVHPRFGHAANLLEDGRVLIVGGQTSGGLGDVAPTSAEIYDPATGKFTETGSMATQRWGGHTTTLLTDGRVLVLGGNTSGVQERPTASAEIYDPKTGKFTSAGSMSETRDGLTATRLKDGRVLVVGGAFLPSGRTTEDLYDPVAGSFTSAGPASVERSGQSATLLSDGSVLIAGGSGIDASALTYAEIYRP